MSAMRCVVLVLLGALLVAGCAGPTAPLPVAQDPTRNVPVERRSLDAPVAREPARAPQASVPVPSGTTPLQVPPTALYVCVSGNGNPRKQTAIEFAPKVGALCKRHPEMGPCQYERDLCRKSGGRVFAANGQEITRQVEDEYDRKVWRARFRAN